MALSDALTRGASNPILTQGGSGAWDEGKIGPMMIVKRGVSDYRAWYEGIPLAFDKNQIGYATSTNGTTWTKYGSNPVMTYGVAWERNEVCPGTIIWDYEAQTYKMWYHGGGTPGEVRDIGYATSPDGITWTKYGSNPILTRGTAGQWDDTSVNDCSVIKFAAGDYRMWYKGESGGVAKQGYATSADGISWSKSGSNPVFQAGTSGQWDDGIFYGLNVIYDAGIFQAWYCADDGVNADATATGIGYASSSNGIAWTRGSSNPVLRGQLSPEEWVSDPIMAYRDFGTGRMRICYGYDDFGVSPVERSRAEAYVALPYVQVQWTGTL